MSGGLDILKRRGFIKQCTDEDTLEAQLETRPVAFYCGFDPTGPSLHAGHMIPLFAMAHLQRAGHKPICISRRRDRPDRGSFGKNRNEAYSKLRRNRQERRIN